MKSFQIFDLFLVRRIRKIQLRESERFRCVQKCMLCRVYWTLVSGHCDIASASFLQVIHILQLSADNFVKLYDVMGSSASVQNHLTNYLKVRNECGRWRLCEKCNVCCRMSIPVIQLNFIGNLALILCLVANGAEYYF